MKCKIKLKKRYGSVFFEHEDEDNSIKKTLEEYIKRERAKGKKFVDLRFADLESTNLEGIDLSGTDLNSADLSNSNLNNSNLRYANLSNAYLSHTDLSGAYLGGADLSGADLRYANLNSAYLYHTDLYYTNLINDDLTNADFSEAKLNSVRNIQQASCCFTGHGELGRQLLAIKINNETMLFCGCFKGNEAELRKYIEEDEEKYKASRLIALDTVLKLIEIEKVNI